MVFIEYLARYLRINRPPPFEIEMPERDGTTEDARLLFYFLEKNIKNML